MQDDACGIDKNMRIVDGHNRQQICEENNIPYTMAVFEFDDDLEAKQWMLDTQKGRRNLDKWELGKIALKLKPEIEARAKANMSAGGQFTKIAKIIREKILPADYQEPDFWAGFENEADIIYAG